MSALDGPSGPSALWGLAPDDIWGVGDFASISHYDGTRWRELSHQTPGGPYLRQYSKMHGSKERDVWIIGSELGEQGNTPLLLRKGP